MSESRQLSRSGEEKPEDHPQAQKSMALAKLMGMQAIERIAPVLATLDQAERVYFFAQWLSGELAHMRAAVGHEATRAIVDGLKLAADGNLDAPASENQTQSVPAGMWYFTYYSEDFDAVQRVRVQGVSAFGKRPDGVTGIVKKEGKNADER